MGEKKRMTNEYYSQGNLAPKIDALSDYFESESFQPQVIEGKKKSVAIKVKKGYTVLLFLVIVLFIAVCAIYLKSAFSLIAVQAEANRLKTELQLLQTQNAQLEHQIHETVDLDKIFDIAVNRLHMRLPERNEIHYITRKAGSYTLKLNQRSYSEENNNLKQFIIFILKDW